jgi:hypothetical protein
MAVRDYVRGADDATRANRRLEASARDMAGQARQAGDEMDATGRKAQAAGRQTGRGMLYAAAGVAALGAAGGAIKVLPGAISAVGVAAGALPPMLLGAAGAGGVLIGSLKGVGAAAGEVLKSDDPFAGLGRNARATVAEIKALQPAMSNFRTGLQDRTLDTAAANLNALATNVLPRVSGGLNDLADDWSDAFDQITASVMSPEFVGAFNSATTGADWFFDLINSRIPQTVASLSTLVTSADPLARSFGQGIVDAIDKFNNAVDRAARTGSLADFFADGAEGARSFMSIAQDILAITGMVIGEVQAQGGTLADTAAALDAYLASGRAAGDVAGIVQTLTTVYEGLAEVLGPLAGMARDALADPGTASAIATMFDVLAAGTAVLRVLFDLFSALPDPVQGLVLVATALALVGGKVAKSMIAMQVAAGRAAMSLDSMGIAGTRASGKLQGIAVGAGRALAALVALQLAGMAISQVMGSNVPQQSTKLADSLKDFAKTGKASGEAAKLFGENLELLKYDLKTFDTGIPTDIGNSIAGFVEGITGLGSSVDESLENARARMASLDATLSGMVADGNGQAAAEIFAKISAEAEKQGISVKELNNALPGYSNAVYEAATKGDLAGQAAAQASERTRILAGSFQEAAMQGKDLAATFDLLNGKTLTAYEGQIALEDAYDKSRKTISENGAAVVKGTNEIDLNTEAGRENMRGLIEIATAASEAADARAKEAGSIQAGIPILAAAREEFIRQATAATGSAAAARALADEIFKIPDKDIRLEVEKEAAIQALRDTGYEIKRLPNGKYVIVKAETAEARRKLAEAKRAVDAINSKTITITVRRVLPSGDIHVSGPGGSGTQVRAHGGVSVPYGRPVAAAMGLVRPDIYRPSDPPLYQFAERETGGELFLPRRGIDRDRGRALLAIAASWYDGMFVPMRFGGVRAAQSGLVNVAPRSGANTTTTDGRLDYIQSYIAAKDAIASLSKTVKENGRNFSVATAKGRENQQATYSAIKAAQDAARAKYEETGSVKAANAVYDAHIATLRRTLAQQKVNATTVSQMLATAGRPVLTAPANSLANIAFVKADIGVRSGIGDLADALSLNRPGVNVGTEHGRENLLAIIGFLESAASAAQARFAQTSNSKTATAYYQGLLGQLRETLKRAGYSSATVDSLIKTYGKITLQPNLRGGVYMAAAGALSEAAVYPGGPTLYGYAEKGTGGELFVPRNGERARSERLLSVGAGWYGGRYVPGGSAAGGEVTVNNHLTVNGRMEPITLTQIQGYQRQMDVEARVGRRR